MSDDAITSKREKAIELDNWSWFDLNLWSAHPEVETAIANIFDLLKTQPTYTGRPNIWKKHLKVAILNLAAAWLTDPAIYVGYYRDGNYYSKVPGRYNHNYIKRTLVKVIDGLIGAGLIIQYIGHHSRTGEWKSHVSRIRVLPLLLDSRFGTKKIRPWMIEKAPTTECIVMRVKNPDTKERVEIDYKDTAETFRMRRDLIAYNNLLRSQFIDLPFVPEQGIKTKSGKYVWINHTDKFVRRIFNNNSWEDGGRFYGGWWQRIPKEWRLKIRIMANTVVEIDYSGLHIVLLYALEGIDYWDHIGTDP